MFTIPNILTALNLFFGCCALVSLHRGQVEATIFLILIAALVDFFDGFIARKLNQASALGVQLDSLSDVVSFGVVPAFICFQILNIGFPHQGYMAYIGFLVAIMAAFRLARYNVESKGTDLFFTGLPVPANALFFLGLYALNLQKNELQSMVMQPYIFTSILLLFSFLMISQIKILKIHFSKIWLRQYGYLLVLELIALGSWIWIGPVALSVVIVIHILVSIYYNIIQNENKIHENL